MKTYIFLKKYFLVFFLFLVSSTVFSQGILQVLDSKKNNVARNSVTDYGDINLNSSKVFNFNLKNIASGKGGKGLKKVTVSISGNDFSVTNSNLGNLKKGTQVTLPIKFSPTSDGLKTAVVTISYSNGVQSSYKFILQGKGQAADKSPEINVYDAANSANIDDGDLTPSVLNSTDFDTVDVGSSLMYTFRVENTGHQQSSLNLSNPVFTSNVDGYFTVSTMGSSSLPKNNTTTFTITFTPLSVGTFTADISIENNDSDENPYNFRIQGTGTAPQPDIDIQGNSILIADTDSTPDVNDGTNFGTTDTTTPVVSTFTMQNNGTADLVVSGISSDNGVFSIGALTYSITIASGSSYDFTVSFLPTTNGTETGTITVNSNVSSPLDIYTFVVSGTGIAPLTEGPGGVTSNLKLWLKANEGVVVNGSSGVTSWFTQAYGSNATVNTPGQEPTFRDEETYNVNFNPVVEFSNAYTSVIKDTDFSFDNTTTQFLEGNSGFYSQDIFVVFIPDDIPINTSFGFMDMFCADANILKDEEDATGIGLGDYSGRISNEIISYAHSTYNKSTPGDGYAVAEIGTGSSYDNVGIINAHNNLSLPQQELSYNANSIGNTQNNSLDQMINVNDTKFWIGRSEGWEASLNGRIAEIITYSTRKNDTDLTQERNRIQSYLAVKYGITLGVNGASQDYVDSDGTIIWDQSANNGFNYDIAGIGRDDVSELNQKQSKSVNTFFDGVGESRGLLTIGLSDIHSTNNLNTATFNSDRQFLCWGNNNASLDGTAVSIEVDMSKGITPLDDTDLNTPVSFEAIQRVWKVIENVGDGVDIPTVKVSIPTNAVRSAMPPDGRYLMFISDTGIFDPTADYRVMTESGGNLYTEYDFDGAKYITFGWAPEKEYERSIYFNPVNKHYIDMEDNLDLNATEFTVSAWINRGINSANTSILSKRNVGYTEGYDFKINGSGKLEMSWGASGLEKITSNTTIPENVWHQVAVIYKDNTANIYIDGVLDETVSGLSNPVNTNSSFFIAAACKNTPEAYFHGNIDEVRVWDIALSEEQLRYIMNQEIEENATFVGGKIIPNTITNNEFNTTLWDKLAGYYPMSVYTYTNTKDESGKGHQGALRNLNTVDWQTAPLPYQSENDGLWNTPSTWLNNTVQDIPNGVSIVDSSISVDWNIVETSHNIASEYLRNITMLAWIQNGQTLTMDGTVDLTTGVGTGNGITVTHYLYLGGILDLEGESQLVQTEGSMLFSSSTGYLERDQQGTGNSFNYNYWTSSVGPIGGANNAPFQIGNVLFDGRDPSKAIVYNASAYAADAGPIGVNPIIMSTYWLYKFHGPENSYNAWANTNQTTTFNSGEGFTMKGSLGAVPILSSFQNYVFRGKPYNGDITLTLDKSLASGADVGRLIGNPYSSAIDVTEFINDNITTTSGTIYLWDHFGEEGSHVLKEYVGGYATRNILAGAPAVSNDYRINNNNGSGTKTPGRYIAVGQGFFVNTSGGFPGGDIIFKNSQRVFKTEAELDSGSPSKPISVFMKTEKLKRTTLQSEKTAPLQRPIIRLTYDSPLGYHRQIVIGTDENTTNGVDNGYDAYMVDVAKEDMFWTIHDTKFVIQGVPNFNLDQEFPLGLTISKTGLATIKIDGLENIDQNLDIYIKDALTGSTTQINNEPFEILLDAGTYLERFLLTFSPQKTLRVEDEVLENGIQVFMNNTVSEIQVRNTMQAELLSIKLYNSLGQLQSTWNKNLEVTSIALPVNMISTGMYLVQINTTTGRVSNQIIINN
ncbi:Por secretion system C-terminal sorting domain-containing protein [Lutibacter agarilyticus]|uniref:Por secretion system C-terminal sorting domain-containing protein n=1 Tax=Lutibacter agarilyticus TaxID=1109740 RepID=A0A238W468_9FLAO|nr:choice-of-anchor D domain-containing protein [Lutibacter agarilyticus]SNR41288.1 Por secretion system C-terminal sorting domain-containing protein [Lutibacter agarilyticus]